MLFDQTSVTTPGKLIMLAVLSFCISMAIAPWLIRLLKRLKFGQVISADSPQSHASKEGTPTMGGIIFLPALLLPLLPVFHGDSRFGDVIAVLLLVVAYAGLGFVDDYLTIRPLRGVRGIASKPKALLQFIIAMVFVAWLAVSRNPNENVLMIGSTEIVSGVAYYIFAVLFIVGMANFINITDGLDGLVSGLTVICAAAFGAALLSAGIPAVTPLIYALGGGLIGFLWYNSNPARVFMGDTGSLAIGALLPAAALVAHCEVFLIIAGLVFILDGLSSAVQWFVFKITRIRTGSGHRVFLKSPVHHHFELCGYPEQTVVVRFWVVGAVAALIGLLYVWG